MSSISQASRRKPGRPRGQERRNAERYACVRPCLVRVAGAAPGDWPGTVYDISVSGIGLALPFPMASGMELFVELRTERGRGEEFHVRVAHSTLHGFVWIHGCSFTRPWSAEKLQTWLREPDEADELG